MRTAYFLVLFGLLTFNANGQMILPEYIIAKKVNDKIHIKWEPKSIEEWEASITKGYTIDLYKINGDGSEDRISSTKMYAEKFGDWDASANREERRFPEMWESAKAFLFPDKIKESVVHDLEKSLVKGSDQTVDSLRLNFISYCSIFDQDLAEAAGLGASIDYPRNGKYKIEVYVDGRYAQSIQFDTEENRPVPKFNVESKWSDRTVEMRWQTRDNARKYFGYIVEKSEDGNRYYRINELPYLDPAVGEDGSNDSGTIMVQDSLDENYKDYYYRIKALDYFGDLAGEYRIVKGYGYDLLASSPAITMADQMTTNEAYLEWQVAQVDVPLIKDFTILRSDAIDGKYEAVVEGLDVNERSTRIPMVYEQNYFRLESNPHDGEPVSSMPVFVMGMDTIAPTQPIAISASIDTGGAVRIKWEANQEPDLGGYRIFRANFSEQEYSLLVAEPTMDTVFVDTVALNLGTENVYYLVQACDKRNNRSSFSDPIIIKKPDITPPGKPMVKMLEQMTDTVAVHWAQSGSPDAVLHRLFKRNLEEESAWTLIAQFDTTNAISPFYDSGNPYDQRIAYTMMAIDDAGLESGLTKMKVKILSKPEEKFEPFISIDTTFDAESGKLKLTWKCNNEENLESVLVYRGFEKDKLGKYKFIDSPFMSIEDDVKEEETVFYSLKPVYRNQNRSYFSDVIEFKNTVDTRR